MKKIIFLLSSLSLLASSAFAESVLTMETKEAGSAAVETAKMFVKGNNVAMNESSNKGGMIFLGDRGVVLALDHERRSYVELNKGSMEKVGDMLGGVMAQMESQMAGMPPEQRQMMQQMMKGKMGELTGQKTSEPISVKKTGEKQKINGYDCVRYEATRGGTVVREFWVTEAKNVEGGAEALAGLRAMGSFMSDMLGSLKSNPLMEGIAQNPFSAFKNIEGLPILSKEIKDGKVASETMLKDIVSQKVGDEKFQAPQGYSKEDPFGGMG